MPAAVAVIPARWGSSRFPGKVLAKLDGRALVLHACDIAARARRIADVVVATDDERVRSAVEGAGYRVVMTAADHASGTDRVAEAARELDAEIVVGLQADEPFLDPADLDALVDALSAEDPPALATLAAPIVEPAEWVDPNAVKVVLDGASHALYFSRAPIPYRRGNGDPSAGSSTAAAGGAVPEGCRLHVGVYGWLRTSLFRFAALPVSPLEACEALEQLRALEAGFRIRVIDAVGAPFGVDTPDDLARAEARIAADRDRPSMNDPSRRGPLTP